LRRQEYRLAVLAKRLAQDPLAAPETVDLGGVEERDPQLECAADDRVRDLLGVLVAVSPIPGPELPGTQPDLGNFPGGADIQITHGSSARPAAAAQLPPARPCMNTGHSRSFY